jgi:DNA sulfur modification protein DndD
MPFEVSQLFFFDGEKIEGLADPIKSSVILKNGIYSLLGINAIDSLIKSLNHIEKRKLTENSSEANRKLIEIDQNKADELSEKKIQVEIEKSKTKVNIDLIKKDLERIESEMKISGADLLEKRHELKSNLLVLTEKRKVIDSKLHELAAGRAPLLLVQEELKKLTQQVNNSAKFSPKTLPLLVNEQKLLIRKLKDSNLKELDIKTVQSIFDSRVTEIKAEIDSDLMIDINQKNLPSSEDLVMLKKEIGMFNIELNVDTIFKKYLEK